MTVNTPTFADVEHAAFVLASYAVATPLIENPDLNAQVGARVLLKCENLQRTGSFKFRGAFNRISRIPLEQRRQGVVAFSSGNHAQGVAAAAALLSIPALIVMPQDAPKAKIEGTRNRGAEIVFYDRLHDNREAIARQICEDPASKWHGATLVPPFDDLYVVAGQGTVGLEIATDAKERGLPNIDWLLAPCSGGGLVSGIALAFSVLSPATEICSVEPENFDGMRQSMQAGERVPAPGGALSVADALMAPMPGFIPFALAQQHLAHGLTVDDKALLHAVSYAERMLKLVVEPGGAAALAYLLVNATRFKDALVAIVLSGGNAGRN